MHKILIADDDRTIRRICADVVCSEGHTCIEASNGKLAWEILFDNPDIKLVILDMMMPELPGQELVKLLRGTTNFKELPIIMISGVVGLREISGILELGASRFMPKPIDTSHLREYLRFLLETSQR